MWRRDVVLQLVCALLIVTAEGAVKIVDTDGAVQFGAYVCLLLFVVWFGRFFASFDVSRHRTCTGPALDVNIYRAGSNALQTDNNLVVKGNTTCSNNLFFGVRNAMRQRFVVCRLLCAFSTHNVCCVCYV